MTDADKAVQQILTGYVSYPNAECVARAYLSSLGREKVMREALEKIARTEGPLLESTACLMQRWAQDALSSPVPASPAGEGERNAALEEAALICEEEGETVLTMFLARRIRSLQSPPRK